MNVQKAVKRKAATPIRRAATCRRGRTRELRHKPFDHIYMEGVLDPAS